MYLTVDVNIHGSIVAKLSASNVTNGEVLPNLLKQTRLRINEILANGAYDTRQCSETVPIK
ncbi:hypothetical protein BTN50_0764 [Candidatus Enterovibrio altilux]|uniref:Mobile element protein n=1 Tax=Candidatus Enterovibrio altilux TaxID=1927128 RepID=A0A291B8E2_9GAMM|nr:hypothetical protein BTN50_0764 [Candidatus Enterovibrio luxaltus]